MIQLSSVDIAFGHQSLLKEASTTIFPSWRVCLIGRNGSGKSTLFKALTGQMPIEGGDLSIPKEWRVAYMAQEVEALDQSALEYVLDGDKELRRIEMALEAAYLEADMDTDKIGRLQADFEARDGYAARARAQKLLAGLGVEEGRQANPVSAFSGGWRIRLNLARTLYQPSDLLLLDEPTNHLDLETVEWLEEWLKHYPGTLLLISHDREFIDTTSDHILHFENKTLKLYTGNYSSFERQRAEQMAQQQAMFEKQQAVKAHLQAYVDRFKAQATKAKQAQSRMKALERLPQIALAHIDSPFTFKVEAWEKASAPLIALSAADCGYGTKTQLHKLQVSIQPGERIGLLGVNGAGKSTLIKSLMGDLSLIKGERVTGEHLRIGYFAQHQLESLQLNEDAYTHMAHLMPKWLPQAIRDYLGSFGFFGDDVFKKVSSFSGGEKARLSLALIAVQRPNLLIMDEPTNHLDIEMREALVSALEMYTGAILLVSHDKHLLESCVDEFWLVDAGQVSEFDGDLADYAKWLKQRAKNLAKNPEPTLIQANQPASANPAPSAKTQTQTLGTEASASAPQKSHGLNPIKLKLRIEALEKSIEKAQARLGELADWLNQPSSYEPAQADALDKKLKEQKKLAGQLEADELEWLELQE